MSNYLYRRPSLFLSVSLMILGQACGKKNGVSVPVPVVSIDESSSDSETLAAEADSETVDNASGPEDTQSSVVEGPSEGVQTDSTESEDVPVYAASINNAVALLTGDEALAQQGLDQLQTLYKLYPDVPEIQYNIGVAQLKLGNRRAAKQAFEETIELDPSFGRAWVNLGVLEEQGNRLNEAMRIYEEGLRAAENDPSLTARKVACLRKMGRYDDAVSFAQQALKKNANNVDAYSEVGAVYLEKGDLDKALFVLQQAMGRSGGDNANLQSVMGKVYYAQEEYPYAEAAFKKALELNPSLIEAAMFLSFIQVNNRAWNNAQSTVSNALALEPDNSALLNLMGIVQRGLGNIDEAEKMYQQAYQVNPDNPEPLINLAVLEADYRNDYQNAYTYLDRYLAEGGVDTDLEEQWRAEFEKSEQDYIAEQKRQEMRERFKRRREEAARKKAEQEAREAEEARLAEEAPQEESVESDEAQTEQEAQLESNTEVDNSEEGVENTSSDEGTQSEEDVSSEGSGWGEAPVNQEVEQSNDDGVDETSGVNDSADADVDTEATSVEASVEENQSSVEEDSGWGTEEGNEASMEDSEDSSENAVNAEEQPQGDINEADTESTPSEDVDGLESQVQSCTANVDCGESYLCAYNGECAPSDGDGVGQIGMECSVSEECGYNLECLESICSENSAAE